jgi:carbonic anhydrase
MEFACKLAGSKLILVLGHSHCGAIKGACADVKLDHLTGLLEHIKPAVAAIRSESTEETSVEDASFVQLVAERNVQTMVMQIKSKSKVLAEMERAGEIEICGGMHDIETGQVRFYQ